MSAQLLIIDPQNDFCVESDALGHAGALVVDVLLLLAGLPLETTEEELQQFFDRVTGPLDTVRADADRDA